MRRNEDEAEYKWVWTAEKMAIETKPGNSPHPTLAPERVGLFVLLTICGFLIFALTMTFVPVLPVWANYAARVGFLVVFGTLGWVARDGHWLNRFRPVFFAYFTAVFGLSLGFIFADRGLKLLGLTTQTPIGIAAAKGLQASLIVIGILAVAKFSGEDLASLYIRKGRLILGLSVGLVTAAALLTLTMLEPAVRALATPRLMSWPRGYYCLWYPTLSWRNSSSADYFSDDTSR